METENRKLKIAKKVQRIIDVSLLRGETAIQSGMHMACRLYSEEIETTCPSLHKNLILIPH
jgi:hypothetical protein